MKARALKELATRAMARMEGRDNHGGGRLVGELRRITDAVEAVERVALARDPAATDAQHIQVVARAGVKLSQALQAAKERRNAIFNEANQGLAASLEAATGLRAARHADETLRYQEIRAVVRGMGQGDRHAALRDAVDRQDTVVVAALVTEGQLLTGLDPEFTRVMRSTFEEFVAPDLVEEQRAILDADEALAVGIRSAQEVASESQHSDFLKKLDESQLARRQADEALTAMDAS